MTVSKQKTIQKGLSVAQVYKELKHDLSLCVMYLEMNRSEIVDQYFGTNDTEKMEERINTVIQEFPNKWIEDIQKYLTKIFIYYKKRE
jgi:hypothetical protein